MSNKVFGIQKKEIIALFGTQKATAEAMGIKQASVAGWPEIVSNGIRLKAIGAARCERKQAPSHWIKAG